MAVGPATGRAPPRLGVPSGASPPSSSTKPPNTLRAALAELRRARSATCSADQSRPAARTAASARAAKPDALEARPLAVGKSFTDTMRARVVVWAAARTRSSSWLARTLGRELSACAPFSSSSSSTSVSSKETVVVVLIPASVTESEGTAGMLPSPARLPQYFASAMLG